MKLLESDHQLTVLNPRVVRLVRESRHLEVEMVCVLVLNVVDQWHHVPGRSIGLSESLRDGTGNALSANVVAMDTREVLAHGDKRLMVLLGVEDLIVVDTADALLIANRAARRTCAG